MYKSSCYLLPYSCIYSGCVCLSTASKYISTGMIWVDNGITNLFVLFIIIFCKCLGNWQDIQYTSPYSYSNSVPKNPPSFAELHSEVLKRGWGGGGGGGTHPALWIRIFLAGPLVKLSQIPVSIKRCPAVFVLSLLYMYICMHARSRVKAQSMFWSIGEKSRRGGAREFKDKQRFSVVQSACFHVIVVSQWKSGLQCKPETNEWICCVFTVSNIRASLTTFTD